MKKLIIFTVVIMLGYNSVFSSNRDGQSIQNDDWAGTKQKTYSLSNDSVNVVVKVIQYSKAIISYELTVVSSKRKIEQKGYALNLSSEINGGVEHETNENGKELYVVAYNSYYCGCSNQIDLEFRIATDNNQLNIVSSAKFRNDLFKTKLTKGEGIQSKVSLLGYLYLKE